jgi:Arc/MetJ-type ribon-helix-helix transcriptional regulator
METEVPSPRVSKRSSREEYRIVTVKIPVELLMVIDSIVETTGKYLNRSDFIRQAIREKIEKEIGSGMLGVFRSMNRSRKLRIQIVELEGEKICPQC